MVLKQVFIFFRYLTRKLTQTKMHDNTFRVIATVAVVEDKVSVSLLGIPRGYLHSSYTESTVHYFGHCSPRISVSTFNLRPMISD